jgi:prolyl 4-hydroxylase
MSLILFFMVCVKKVESNSHGLALASPSIRQSSHAHFIAHTTGRPFPMRGRFYANIFVHFEPTGALSYDLDTPLADILMDQVGQVSMSHGLPPYIIHGSEWEEDWRSVNPRGWELSFADPHEAATNSNLNILKEVALHDPSLLHKPDDNGWHPLHEAAVHGHPDVVKFLLEAGADVNQLTSEEGGSSPLALAKHFLEDNHPIFELLEQYGAFELGPEL